MLDDISGTLQTDGYSAYQSIGKRKDMDLIFCMAHARRKFYDARATAPDIAHHFLKQVQQLYELERQARDQKMTPRQRLQIRRDKVISILKNLEIWLIQQHVDKTLLPKSRILKVIELCLASPH